MDILGVGPLELVFVLILMLLLLGPKGMVRAVHDIGEFLRKVVQSPIWKSIINSSQEIRQVQTQIIKESGLDESIKEIRASTKSINQVTNNLVKPVLDESRIDPVSMKVPKPVEPTKPAVTDPTPAPEVTLSAIVTEEKPEPVPAPGNLTNELPVDPSTEKTE